MNYKKELNKIEVKECIHTLLTYQLKVGQATEKLMNYYSDRIKKENEKLDKLLDKYIKE